MRDVIQKILTTESEAKQLVQAARTEVEQLLSNVRLQARNLVEQAYQETKAEAENILAVAEAEAAREKAERLAGAAAEINATIRLEETTAQQAAQAALRCVCGSSR